MKRKFTSDDFKFMLPEDFKGAIRSKLQNYTNANLAIQYLKSIRYHLMMQLHRHLYTMDTIPNELDDKISDCDIDIEYYDAWKDDLIQIKLLLRDKIICVSELIDIYEQGGNYNE